MLNPGGPVIVMAMTATPIRDPDSTPGVNDNLLDDSPWKRLAEKIEKIKDIHTKLHQETEERNFTSQRAKDLSLMNNSEETVISLGSKVAQEVEKLNQFYLQKLQDIPKMKADSLYELSRLISAIGGEFKKTEAQFKLYESLRKEGFEQIKRNLNGIVLQEHEQSFKEFEKGAKFTELNSLITELGMFILDL